MADSTHIEIQLMPHFLVRKMYVLFVIKHKSLSAHGKKHGSIAVSINIAQTFLKRNFFVASTILFYASVYSADMSVRIPVLSQYSFILHASIFG